MHIELLKWISFWTFFAIGLGGSLYVLVWVWDRTFTALVNMFDLKKEFIDFIWQKYKRKTFTPKVNEKEERQ